MRQLRQCWKDVGLIPNKITDLPGFDFSRPTDDRWYSEPAFVQVAFATAVFNTCLGVHVWPKESSRSVSSFESILATIVAFIGVLSALMALQLERARELGTLRAVGMTQRQLWSMTMLETALMGSTAGLWAMPTGFA